MYVQNTVVSIQHTNKSICTKDKAAILIRIPLKKGMTKVNTQNETMTNSVKMPGLLYGLWQSLWGLPIHLLIRKSREIGKYPSANIPRMPILHTVLMDELQSSKMYLIPLIR